MKIQAARNDLLDSINRVSGVLYGSEEDLSSHILIRSKGGEVELLSSMDPLFCLSPLTATVEGEGEFAVEGKRLKQWVTSVKSGLISLELYPSGVMASSDKGQILLPAYSDLSDFPYWDKQVSTWECVAKVESGKLSESLKLLQHFSLEEEGLHPEYCVIEMKDSVLMAFDGSSFSYVDFEELKDTGFTFHARCIKPLQKFLSADKAVEVELLMSKEVRVFRYSDGSYFGCSRPLGNLPTFDFRVPDAHLTWTVDVNDLNSSLNLLEAGSKKGSDYLRLLKKGGKFFACRARPQGGENDLEISVEEVAEREMREEGVMISLSKFNSARPFFQDEKLVLRFFFKERGAILLLEKDRLTSAMTCQYQ